MVSVLARSWTPVLGSFLLAGAPIFVPLELYLTRRERERAKILEERLPPEAGGTMQ
jgi:hypothetical protein